MWVYRTGKYYTSTPIVLYDYRKNRNAEAPIEFLKGFRGIVLTDAYSAYRKVDRQEPDIEFAACWAHSRRRFAEALQALKPKERGKAKDSIAHDALERIAAIYHLDNELSDLTPAERQKKRKLRIEPLVEAYFAWARETLISAHIDPR